MRDMVPAAQHRLDGARQKAHHRMAFQGVIEIEAGGNSEALQGGAQRRRVDLGGPHDDAHLAEGTSRFSLKKNAAGDLFDFTLEIRRLDEFQRAARPAGGEALLGRAHTGEPCAQGWREVLVAQGEHEVGVPVQGGHHTQFGVGQGVKAIHPDGVDAAQPVRGDLCGSEFQTAGAHGEAPSGQFPVDFPVDGKKRLAEGSVGKTGRQARAIASGRGKLLDRVGQRFAEPVKANDAGKLGARDALRSLFDQKIKDG